MGLTYYDAKRLWEARLAGVSFDNVLTCSHLQLFLHREELASLRRGHRSRSKASPEPLAGYTFGQYADSFWRDFLEAKSVETMDFSEYEGASIVHDLNAPVPESLHQRFDAIIEAGSLEHVFNFPVAIRNLMMMTKVGGGVFLSTVANNFCGHGFYQFSPELIYRIFSPENGFETTSVVFLEATYPAVELTPMRAVYQVADPKVVRSRVGLQSGNPIVMVVDAKKTRHVEPFSVVPQQSDYVAAWEKVSAPPPVVPGTTRTLAKRIFRALPAEWQQRVQGYRDKSQFSLSNKIFYRRLH